MEDYARKRQLVSEANLSVGAPRAVVAEAHRRKACEHLKLGQVADAHGAYKHAQEKESDESTVGPGPPPPKSFLF